MVRDFKSADLTNVRPDDSFEAKLYADVEADASR